MNSCVAVETPSTAAAQYIHCILTGETDSDFCRTLTYGSDTAGCVVAGPPVGHIPSCVLRRSAPPSRASLRRRADDGWHCGTFESCADRIRFDSVVHGLEAHFCAEPDSDPAIDGAALDSVRCGGLFHAGGDLGGVSAIGFARNSNVFLLAKWVDEGPALSYLKRACPTDLPVPVSGNRHINRDVFATIYFV
jgi:hypothetical protein